MESEDPVTQCVNKRQVVFSSLDDASNKSLHQFMDAQDIVLIPLLSAHRCLGVLIARVPAPLRAALQGQLRKLQAFGVYAGLALARRHQADKLRRAQLTVARQEGRLELLRISHDVKQLISLYADAYPFTAIDLRLSVSEMVQLLQDSQLIPDNIHIDSQLTGRLTQVQGSAQMIKQVVHILLKNAWGRLPNGGEIGLEVGALVQRQGAMFAALSVSDNAVGESVQHVKTQLFEPIFGQAIDAQGLQDCAGLGGLNSVNFLVEKMGGYVKCHADEFGTRFDVYLPCAKTA